MYALRIAGASSALLAMAACSTGPGELAAPARCGADGVAVQVLGSGGPVPDDDRASAGYLVWVDGAARVLVDAGGGVFQRFAASGAKIEDLEHIAITHLHADHSAGLAALVKGGFFSPRTDELTISGPSQGGDYPSLDQFLQREFAPSQGAYEYLAGTLDGTGGMFALVPRQIDHTAADGVTVAHSEAIVVTGVGVDHGPVPAVGYVVTIGSRRIGFSGDQAARRDDFWRLAKGVDMLVMHHAVPEDAGATARNLHATPGVIGERAAAAGAGQLVLSHHMARSLATLDENLVSIRRHYRGPVEVARDLDCYSLE